MTDGNGEEAARGGGSDEEATWLDLIGRFDAPADSPDAPVPWPDRENLGPSARAGTDTAPPAADDGNGPRTDPGLRLGDRTDRAGGPGRGGPDERGPGRGGPDERGPHERGPDGGGPGEGGPGEHGPGERGLGERHGLSEHGRGDGALGESKPWAAAGTDGPWPAADTDPAWPSADTDRPWPAAETDGTAPGRSARWPQAEDAPGEGPAGTGLLPDAGQAPDGRFVLPAHQPPGMPSPAAPRSWSPPGEDEDEGHYVPPPPPPLPALAPGTKAAWTGLFGGPGYLLVATLAGWSVPGWALFLAIAAFVGGFTALVLRQSDRPDEDSDPDGPDDGAVL